MNKQPKIIRQRVLVYALDETQTVNRWTAFVQGGYVNHRRKEHTSDAELEAVAMKLAAVDDMLVALWASQKLFEEALPKFNWGASALDANAIKLLNEVPGEVRAAIAKAHGAEHVRKTAADALGDAMEALSEIDEMPLSCIRDDPHTVKDIVREAIAKMRAR